MRMRVRARGDMTGDADGDVTGDATRRNSFATDNVEKPMKFDVVTNK